MVAVGAGAAPRTAIRARGLSERRVWFDHLSMWLPVPTESARPRGSKPTAQTHPASGENQVSSGRREAFFLTAGLGARGEGAQELSGMMT